MAFTQEEKSIRSLQRYHNNRDEINETQKKYFRDKWYRKNRQKCLEYQRVARDKQRRLKYNILPCRKIEINNIVTFN